MPQSFDSGRPINSHYRYESASMNDHEYEYGSGPGQGFTPVTKRAGGTSKWLKYGLPSLLLLIVAGAVAGIVIHKHSSDSSTSSSGGSNGTSSGGGGGGTSAGDLGVFYTATDAYGQPVYPTTVRSSMHGILWVSH